VNGEVCRMYPIRSASPWAFIPQIGVDPEAELSHDFHCVEFSLAAGLLRMFSFEAADVEFVENDFLFIGVFFFFFFFFF